MSKNNIIFQIGLTSDNKKVVNGIWKTFETHGLPLDSIFIACINNNSVPDWILLYKQMRKSGMAHGRIISKLDESISDSFGKQFGDEVISRLGEIFGQI
jgi:hypothetical protein